nr:hypothetical protein Iba_chr15eCG0960 [Ipomoea batatas]
MSAFREDDPRIDAFQSKFVVARSSLNGWDPVNVWISENHAVPFIYLDITLDDREGRLVFLSTSALWTGESRLGVLYWSANCVGQIVGQKFAFRLRKRKETARASGLKCLECGLRECRKFSSKGARATHRFDGSRCYVLVGVCAVVAAAKAWNLQEKTVIRAAWLS